MLLELSGMTTQPTSLPQDACDADQDAEHKSRAKSKGASPAAGMLWFGGWLFTIGFAKLVWWKALVALVVWPYFLGVTLR